MWCYHILDPSFTEVRSFMLNSQIPHSFNVLTVELTLFLARVEEAS